MAFLNDLVGNIGSFLGINPDTKKKPQQVVTPQNTLRQQAVRPTGLLVDKSAPTPQNTLLNDQTEQARKRREEEARLLRIAQEQAKAKAIADAKAQAERQARQVVAPSMTQRADGGFDFNQNGKPINVDEYVKMTGKNKAELIRTMASRGDGVSQRVIAPKASSLTFSQMIDENKKTAQKLALEKPLPNGRTAQSLVDEYNKSTDLKKRQDYRNLIERAQADPTSKDHELAVLLAPQLKNNALEDVKDFTASATHAFMGGAVESVANTANFVGAGFNAEEAQKRTDSFLRDINQNDANGQVLATQNVNTSGSDAGKWGEGIGQAEGFATDMATMVLPGVLVEKALMNIPKIASWTAKGDKVSRFLKSMVPVVAGGTTSSAVGQIQDPTQNVGQNFGIGLAGDFAGGFIGAGLSRLIGKIKSGAPLSVRELEQLAKEADKAEQATSKLVETPTPRTVAETIPQVTEPRPADVPVVNPTDLAYKPISVKTVGRLTSGDAGAATAIIRNSGRHFAPDVERQIAEELGMARTPELTKAVLNKYGIPIQETPAEALVRQNASGEQVATTQAKALDSASQEVVPQEVVPTAPNVPEQVAAPSADIAQNTDAFGTPRPEVKVPTADAPLSKADQAKFDETFGVPTTKGAVDRAMTPEDLRKPAPRQAENPAILPQKDGTNKVLNKAGVASDNTAQFAEALAKEGDSINGHFGDSIRQVENMARKVEDQAPQIGKHLEEFRASVGKAQADVVRSTDAGTAYMKDSVFGGMNRTQQDMTKYLIENQSNTKLMAKYAQSHPQETLAAKNFAAWAKEQLPAMNEILKAHHMKEIGNIKDYFPRMMELNKTKNSLSDMLIASAESTNTMGEARISKGFMKTRAGIAGGKELSPADAANLYARQVAQVTHLTSVVERGKAMTAVIESTQSLPSAAKQQLTDLFTQITNQVAGKGVTPTSGFGKAAAKLRNVASRSSIMGSVNSIYAQIANPAAVLNRMFADGGITAGTKDGLNLLVNSVKTLKKSISELETIDGMTSDFLTTARGAKSTGKHLGSKITDAGYKFSNFGDLQSKNAAVQTIYDRIREATPTLPKEQALRQAERDVKFAIGDRTMGERSAFTASANPASIIASQYQIEQIANVMNFVDGVVLNPRLGPWKKVVGSMAAAMTAYGANQVTGALSNGAVKPVPDVLGAGLDAYARIEDMNQQRQKNGEDPLTPAQMAGLFATNFGASFISNLPLGRTALAPVNAVVDAIGANPAIDNKNLANDLGLNPRDTNPLQTLPAIGLATTVAKEIGDGFSGAQTPLQTAVDVASKVIPGGGQAKKTGEGITAFVQGGTSYPDTTDKTTGIVTPGDKKFSVNNDLSTGEGWHNLLAMATSGQFANKGAQDYLKSEFKTEAQRSITAGAITPDKVASLTDPQYEAYKADTSKKFAGQLSDSDKAIYKTMQNMTLLKRNLAEGKITQDQVDSLTTQKNKYLFDKGLTAEINTGYSLEDMKKFTPEVQAYLTDKAISGKSKYKDLASTDASKAVISQAMGTDPWPTIDTKAVTPTNALAEKYVTYQKALTAAGTDQAAQFAARKTFWAATVKQGFDSKAVDVYDSSDEGGMTNAKGTYAMSIANIKQMVSPEGLSVGASNYRINKTDLDAMVELDNRLLKAGLISQPKFSNTTRKGFGYGAAPASELDGLGYVPKDSSASGSSSSSGTRSGAATFLTSLNGNSNAGGMKLDIGGDKQRATPKLNLAQYQNKGTKSGKSSIKIVL